MTDTLPQRIEAAERAETADLLYEAWNKLAQADADFRHFACTVIHQRTGKTNAGRFAELLEVGAFTDAALMLVPEGWDWFRWSPGSMVVSKPHESEKLWAITVEATAATPALALCAAALRAKDQTND